MCSGWALRRSPSCSRGRWCACASGSCEARLSALHAVGLLIALVLFAYLVVALLRPEKF